MGERPLGTVVRRLQQLAAVALAPQESDAQLLARYTSQQDAEAFALLVCRHGPLVWRVCRRVVGRAADAEDCFQATFLVLAQRAGSIRNPAALAGWLYRVALRIARAARSAVRHQTLEAEEERARQDAEPADAAAWRELVRIVDEEVEALPDALRLPILLCYWQGLTNDEAAAQLQWPAGTVKTRLARARHLLHRRLTRRGVALPVGVVALLCAPAGSEAVAPATCMAAAVHVLVGRGSAVSAHVARLAAVVVRGMIVSRLQWALALALVVTFLAASAWWATATATHDEAVRPGGAATPPAQATERAKAARTDRHGDPLPERALMRLGTLRHRNWSGLFAHEHRLPDGRTWLRSNGEDTIDWFDVATGRITASWSLPKGLTLGGFSPDGRRAMLTDGKTLRLWDLVARKEISSFARSGDPRVRIRATFAADEQIVAVTAYIGMDQQRSIDFFDLPSGRFLWQAAKDQRELYFSGFVGDAPSVVLTDFLTNRVNLRDRTTGKEVRSFTTMPSAESRSSGLSPDGKAIVFGTSTGAVRVWDLATGKERPALGGHERQAYQFQFSADGKRIMTGGGDRTVNVREWPSGKLVKAIDLGAATTKRGVKSMVFMPGGQQVAITISPEIAPRWFDLASGTELPREGEAHFGAVFRLAILAENKLISGGYDDSIRVWDLNTGRQVQALDTGDPWNAEWLAPSADGRLVATGNYNSGAVRLHDLPTGRLVRTLTPGGSRTARLAFVPGADGLLVFGTMRENPNGRLGEYFSALWNVHAGKEVRRFPEAVGPAVSPDGQRLAAFVQRRPVVWHLAHGLERELPVQQISDTLLFSPDNRLLGLNSGERVILWELASGQECFRIDVAAGGYRAMTFSPDGRWLARADKSAIQLIDTLHGSQAPPLTGHAAWVHDLVFTPDGRRLVSASFDSTILVWDVSALSPKVPPTPLADAAAAAAAWKTLASTGARAAYLAVGSLAASPQHAVPLLRAQLQPVKALAAKEIQQWIDALDSDDFAARQAATQALEQGDGQTEAAIDKALKGTTSLEARRRLQNIRRKLVDAPSAEALRARRAIWVLERIGSPDAHAVLTTLASGAPGDWATRDALAALERLKKRSR